MKKSFLVLITIALIGCAHYKPFSFGLDYLKDKPVDKAFSALGYPDSKLELDGRVVYIWQRSHVEAYTALGNRPPIYSESSCQIKIIADSRNVVRDWGYQENDNGCEDFKQKANQFALNQE